MYAQLNFEEHIIADDTHLPQVSVHVQLADLDGDGDNDLLSASQDDHKIAWFANTDGNGDFGTQNIISVEVEEAQYVRAGDLDGDGDIDVVGVGRENALRGFINDGAGNFTPRILLDDNSEDLVLPRNVHISDIDLDGKMDLVVFSETLEILFYRNINNDFQYEKNLAGVVGESFSSSFNYIFDVADIDNDGDEDIISISTTYKHLSWHENINSDFVTHEIENIEGHYHVLKLADLDNDNDLDLVTCSNSIEERPVWIEFDSVNKRFENIHILIDDELEIYSLDVLDVHNNGSKNIVLSSHNYKGVVWIDDVYNPQDSIRTVTDTLCPFFLLAGDIDGDEHMDVVTSDIAWVNYDVTVQEFDYPKWFTRYTNTIIDLGSIDVDEDGDLDVLTTLNDIDGRLGWFENVGGNVLFDSVQILVNEDFINMSDMHLVDLDGDEDIDIVLASHYPDVLAWIRNEGNSVFSAPIVIDDVIQNPNSIDVGDIDLDGKLDILIETDYSVIEGVGEARAIVWYRNIDGLGNFSSANKILVNGPEDKMTKLTDIDGDGDLDVICAMEGLGLRWIENLIPGFFWNIPIDIMEDSQTISVLDVGDIDGDGDIDVVYSDRNADAIFISINRNGVGSFDKEEIIYEKSSDGLKLEDMDNDGDLDIVALIEVDDVYDEQNIVYIEQVNGSFESDAIMVNESVLSDARNMILVDIDDDGDIDVMSASRRDDKLAWYENQSMVSTKEFYELYFEVSPQPASSRLRLKSVANIDRVLVYTINGKLQLMSKMVNEVDISSLASGIYVIQIFDIDGNHGSLKFVKE